MRKRSRRLVKKLHRRLLHDVLVEASLASNWRSRLFDPRLGEVFEISNADLAGLTGEVATAIQKYGLRFSVATVDPAEAEAWLSENGEVVFAFWAADFPRIRTCSGNNPHIR
jgi:hypothetical protein